MDTRDLVAAMNDAGPMSKVTGMATDTTIGATRNAMTGRQTIREACTLKGDDEPAHSTMVITARGEADLVVLQEVQIQLILPTQDMAKGVQGRVEITTNRSPRSHHSGAIETEGESDPSQDQDPLLLV
jgi:hypothetical protein